MEPKKDVSTAILDQKKAPNKLIVINLLFRSIKLWTTKTHLFSFLKLRCLNLKYLKGMPFSLREKKENKL